MKRTPSDIYSYTIGDMGTDNGRKVPEKEFYVFSSDNHILNERLVHHLIRSDHFLVILIVDGVAKVQYGTINYTLPKNTLFIIHHGVLHKFLKPEKNTCTALGMGFTREFLGTSGLPRKHIDVFGFLSSQNNPDILLEEKDAETLKVLMMLIREKNLSEEDHSYKTEVLHYGFLLFMFELAAIVKKYSTNYNTKLTRKEDVVMGFVKLLAVHFKKERSVRFYADALFISPRHFSKIVKEITNKSAGELIDNMVIAEAKILLDDLGMSVANVADELHFSDQFFFSKFFKKHAGINPSEYKSSM